MKKFLSTLFTVAVAGSAMALTVTPAVKITTGSAGHNPVLSPDGATLLFSAVDHTGLKALDMITE